MKKILSIVASAFVMILMLSVSQVMAQRTTIAGWTFPSTTSPNAIPAECGEGTLYADGTHGSSEWTVVTSGTNAGIYFSNNGAAPSAALCDVTTATKDITFIGSANNGNSAVFVVSTLDMMDIQISFNERGSGTGFVTETWSHSVDGVNFVEDTVLTGMNSGTNATYPQRIMTIEFPTDVNNQSEVYIKVTFDGASGTGGNNRLDNIEISGVSDLPITAQPQFSQLQGNYCNSFSVEITCASEGASIYYTLDGTTPDSLTGTLYTEPILIDATTTLSAIAYADGLDVSSVNTANYVLPTEVSTISEFKNDTENTYFKLTGDLTVSHQTGSYIFIQDATAATCIYGSGMPTFTNGNVISGGVCGVKSPYYGLVEIANAEFLNPTPTTGTAVEPIEVTIAELNANFDDYDCKLVTVTNATFQSGTFSTSSNSCVTLSQGSDEILACNQLRVLDNYSVPSGMCSVTGFAIPHDDQHRLAPRGEYDIVPMIADVTITSPAYGEVYEQNAVINPAFTYNYFDFENGSMIHVELTLNGENVLDTYLHDADEVAAHQSADLMEYLTEIGDCQYIVSLVTSDNAVLATDTAIFLLTTTYVAIETSETALSFEATNETHTFTVTAFNLTETIAITVDNAAFEVTPVTLPANANAAEVTVTFVGEASANGTVTLTSGDVVTTVALNAVIPIDEVIYTVGFEADEDFNATNTYNNPTIRYDGPEDQQWGSYFGTVSTTSPIDDAQSMQMRWYTTSPDAMGYAITNFNLHNVTKVEFAAKYRNQHVNLRVSRSLDGGATYGADSVYVLTTNPQDFTYFVSDSGQYYSVRLKFQIELDEDDIPSNTAHCTFDRVRVYGVTGLEPSVVDDPVISEPSNSYVNPITVTLTCATEGATIYYTTDGTTPDETSMQYYNPFVIDSTCTLKARAFKGGMDPSNVAFAEYTFPTAVANIAEFKAAGALAAGTYRITGSVTFVYRNGRRIFIEDATGGLLVYDNTTPVVTRTYNEGDVISGGIVGTYSLYNGLNEMVPVADWAAAFGTATVNPVLVDIQLLTTNFAEYESRLVRINDVNFPDGLEFTTDETTEVVMTDETGSAMFRNQFKTLDTTLAAGANADVMGFASIYMPDDEPTYQILPRSNADIIEIVGIDEAEMLGVSLYPNPTTGLVNVSFEAATACEVQICDMFGRILSNSQMSGEQQLDFSAYAPGMYIVRFTTTDGRTAVVKVTRR